MEAASASRGSSRILSAIEWIAAAGITLAAIYLHFVFLKHAGSLWRDEVSSIDLANLPGFKALWEMLNHDSFPLLWSLLLLRGWETIGLGDSDGHLRWLGFLVGLLLLGSIWIAARVMSGRVPLVALALFAISATTVWSGDSLRAYGLGTALNILTLAFLWRFYEQPTLRHGLTAAVLAALSVQCLYQNAFLLLAAGLSAVLLFVRQKRWCGASAIIAIGAIAAGSLLPYRPQIVRSQDWWMLEQSGFDPRQLWGKASEAIGFPFPWFNLVWIALIALALAIGMVQPFRVAKDNEQTSRDRALAGFAALSLLLGIVAFILFLKLARLPTQPWYYLPLMGFAALCLEQILSGIKWTRPLAVVASVAIAICGERAALPLLQNRQTNMDLVADQLARQADPNDFIVVNFWYHGVTFQRYYHGPTPWMTVPPLPDLTIHRYDLMKVEMQKNDAMKPVLEKAANALRTGHKVWLVGRIPLDGQPPPVIQPAPNNPWVWLDFPYTQVWQSELGYFVTQHATGAQSFPIDPGINPLENAQLASVSGWRE